MKIPRTPERRITPLFGSVGFCSRKGHSLAVFAHIPSPIALAKSAEDYSWEIAEWQLARRSIGASYAEVCLFCHSGFFDTCFQSILRVSPTGRTGQAADPRRGPARKATASAVDLHQWQGRKTHDDLWETRLSGTHSPDTPSRSQKSLDCLGFFLRKIII
jgi:hypothetical protein